MSSAAAVVIPAYNEANTIYTVASLAKRHVTDVIVVDDGSTDGTGQCLASAEVTVLRNASNNGKAASICRGARYAIAHGARRVITMDGDGQHSAADLPALLDAANRYPDAIVIGVRSRYHGEAPKLRRFANRFADFWISWACGHKVRDTQSGFRVYPNEVLLHHQVSVARSQCFVFESEILIRAVRDGWQVQFVEIETAYEGVLRPSHYRPIVDTARIVRMVAGKLLRRGMDPVGLWRSLGIGEQHVENRDANMAASAGKRARFAASMRRR